MSPKEIGFWRGVEHARKGERPLPPNPYPLRSKEREDWYDGYRAGRKVGDEQLEAAKKKAADLASTEGEAP